MSERPTRVDYYLAEALAVAARAECRGQHVGAVIVGAGNRVLSTGYNGAPEGWGNCSDGGVCPRCDMRDQFGPGNAYDKCICVHAEMNAISAAARFGMALDGSTAYVTHQPCFTCAKEMIQAGIARVYYAIALPVGSSCAAELSVQEREQDLFLKRTEARLLGQLRAVHVKDFTGARGGLRRAVEQFDEELRASVGRADAAQKEVETAVAAERSRANGSRPRPRAARPK